MGTFDYLNMRLNGYQFHMDLMRPQGVLGPEEGQRRLRHLEGPAALPGPGRARPDLAGGGADAGQQEVGHVPARLLRHPAVHRQGRAGRHRLLPVPRDRHARARTPSRRPSTACCCPRRAATTRRPRTSWPSSARRDGQNVYASVDSSNIATAKGADTSKFTPLNKKCAEAIAQRQVHQPVLRPRRAAGHGQQRHDPGPADLHQGRQRST